MLFLRERPSESEGKAQANDKTIYQQLADQNHSSAFQHRVLPRYNCTQLELEWRSLRDLASVHMSLFRCSERAEWERSTARAILGSAVKSPSKYCLLPWQGTPTACAASSRKPRRLASLIIPISLPS